MKLHTIHFAHPYIKYPAFIFMEVVNLRGRLIHSKKVSGEVKGLRIVEGQWKYYVEFPDYEFSAEYFENDLEKIWITLS